MINQQDLTLMPDKLSLAMLVIIATQVGVVHGETYWTFYPNAPVLHPITCGDESVPICK